MDSFALMALDKRFRVAVACVTPAGDVESTGKDEAFAPRNFARALDGRPFLMQMGRNDPYCNEAQAQRVYDLIPGSKKEIVYYESGHMLPVDYVSKATEWLRKELK